MRFIAKATPIGYINSKCHIKRLKSSRTCLIGYSGFISRHQLFMASGADTHTHTHTHTHTRILTSRTKQFQETRRRPARTWFKNIYMQPASSTENKENAARHGLARWTKFQEFLTVAEKIYPRIKIFGGQYFLDKAIMNLL